MDDLKDVTIHAPNVHEVPIPTPKRQDSVTVKAWKSCCCQVDQRCITFSAKFFVSFWILGFSTMSILLDPDACSNSLIGWHTGMIAAVMTAWVKDSTAAQPKIKSEMRSV